MSVALPFALKGAGIGFSIAAPVGPIGVLCIRRSVAEGPAMGLATGLGAATADALYGLVAAFGLTAISSFLVGERFWLALVGGIFLACLGIRTFLSRPASTAAAAGGYGLGSAYLSTLFLTLTNPTTILAFIAVFAGVGLGAVPDPAAAAWVVAGVLLGSAAWWLILSQGLGLLRGRFRPEWMAWVNRLSGCVLIAFAAYALRLAYRTASHP